jgi:CBS domain-containing protein
MARRIVHERRITMADANFNRAAPQAGAGDAPAGSETRPGADAPAQWQSGLGRSDPDARGSLEAARGAHANRREQRASPAGSALAIQVQEIMTHNVEVIDPDGTIQQAAEVMARLDVGLLPVGNADRVLGVLSDRDITIRATAKGYDPRRTKVREVMTTAVWACFLDQDVAEAARLMQEKQIRRLVVLDRSQRLAGIVSLGDVAVSGGNDLVSGSTLERVSEIRQPEH